MKISKFLLMALLLVPGGRCAWAQDVAKYNVTWQELGTDENASMPLGNGEIAGNVWTEPNGDVVLLLARTDAWSENAQLLKVGRVRISFAPNPFKSGKVAQTLHLEDGTVVISSGNDEVRIWADANLPVVRVKSKMTTPTKVTAKLETWRKEKRVLTQQQVNENLFNYWEWRSNPNGITLLPDTQLKAGKDRVAQCHYNAHSMYPVVFEQEHLGSLLSKYPDPLKGRCFGIVAKGKGFAAQDDNTLVSNSKDAETLLNLYVDTYQTESPQGWLRCMNRVIDDDNKQPSMKTLTNHKRWWKDFWNRSWIEVSGDQDAWNVSQGYAINRYMTACTGRGRYPMKFNGSHFTVGHDMPAGKISVPEDHDPDFRDWGGCYWNQNSRHMYWPLMATGDFDMMQPWFGLYTNSLQLAKDRTKLYFHHDGASWIETIHFFGLPNLMDFGWNNKGVDPESNYMKWHYQGALEVLMMMLDYYDYTHDAKFLTKQLLPMGEAITTFYNEHWKRGADGKILFSPSQSIEMYQVGVVNPLPDIAGLNAVLPRLMALPQTSAQQQALWKTMLTDLPEMPVGTTQDGKLPLNGKGDETGIPTLLPAAKYGERANGENPELYAVFPYRNFMVGKPNLQLAINTFHARRFPFANCWGQDGQEAALLGLTDIAQASLVKAMTTYGKQKFKWFWGKVADYSPDMDNGGTAMETLQLMLLQFDGAKIRLIPAWPSNWTAHFKLHAPQNTTIEAVVENGQVKNLIVLPASRAKDVILGK